MSRLRSGIEPQRLLEGCFGVVVVLLVGIDNSEQVVCLDIARVHLQLIFDEIPCLLKLSMLDQFPGLNQLGIGLGSFRVLIFGRFLLRVTRTAKQQYDKYSKPLSSAT